MLQKLILCPTFHPPHDLVDSAQVLGAAFEINRGTIEVKNNSCLRANALFLIIEMGRQKLNRSWIMVLVGKEVLLSLDMISLLQCFLFLVVILLVFKLFSH